MQRWGTEWPIDELVSFTSHVGKVSHNRYKPANDILARWLAPPEVVRIWSRKGTKSLRADRHLWYVSFDGVVTPQRIPSDFSEARRTSGRSGTVPQTGYVRSGSRCTEDALEI